LESPDRAGCNVPLDAACLDAVMGFEKRPPVHAAEQHPLEPAVERCIAPACCGMTKRECGGSSRPRGERMRRIASVRRTGTESDIPDEVHP
jgi:hypothetical protein